MINKLNISAKNVINNLRELAELTSDDNGAQRLAWTDTWQKAREWFEFKAKKSGAKVTIDSAGNMWAKLEGVSSEAIAIGSHIDSVPNGGWLDGALGVVAGLEVLNLFSNYKPKKTIYVVNWADEEGARFGRSCFGSAAACGNITTKEMAARIDLNGIKYEEIIKEYGVNPNEILNSSNEFKEYNIKKYLELHIEQGPVLENKGKDVACVYGVAGVERHYFDFVGQSAHAGSFPIFDRKDAFLAAAESALEFRKIALKYDAFCTVGEVFISPCVTTIVPGQCTISLDQRTINNDDLKSMFTEAKEVASRIAKENGVNVTTRKIHSIEPVLFDDKLVNLCKESIKEETGYDFSIYSGPLHDAVEVARIMPSVMMFAMSENGLSHTKEENTPNSSLETAIRAFLRLSNKVIKD
ncbi:hydantoinase/carbamoylase family amidase [Miniphocaeibacter massiliensis]|uniref:hydantoinase/carbamoylase family amidase n=1 Tax=Miniphocaeibacter massiliensis TaxID=2041841 RepID=UPI000C1BDA61|nr:hydantoinase/carbamoylase family amidase [Miniphocaeibacter massiliensis]